MTMRPCLECGRPTTHGPRCPEHAIDTRSHFATAEYQLSRAQCLIEERTCSICGKPGDLLDPLTADHIVPVIAGGTHARSNLRAAHRSCNSRRGATTRAA